MYYLLMSIATQNLSCIHTDFKMIEIYLCKIIMIRIIFKRNDMGVYFFYFLQIFFFKLTNHKDR